MSNFAVAWGHSKAIRGTVTDGKIWLSVQNYDGKTCVQPYGFMSESEAIALCETLGDALGVEINIDEMRAKNE